MIDEVSGNRSSGPRLPLILIVDDEREVRLVLAKVLRAEGFDVVQEMDGRGALETIRLLRPDLVLLDVMMPQMDGFEVCRILRADPDRLVRAESVVLSLARSIEGKDPSTEGHCERLADFAVLLGERMGLDAIALEALSQAGFLHDIGKIAVQDSILLKAGPLTPQEWVLMKRHPIIGEHICSPIDSFREVLPIIRHHHEKGDGSGYPDGLSGQEIPGTARILQIVDVFDALTSHRPYKKALPVRDALDILTREVAKGWWDSDCRLVPNPDQREPTSVWRGRGLFALMV